MVIPDTKIAVTLFNLREHCKTLSDLSATLARVKEIGYEAVQISGVGPIPPEDIRKCLDDNGIYCCATHESFDDFKNDCAKMIERMKILGCDFTAIGGAGKSYNRRGGAVDLAADLNKVGEQLKAGGIRFGYHNHHGEFQHYEEKSFMEILVEKTSPEDVCFEIDVHWVQRGGGSPASWIRRVAGRIPVAHFKDYSIVESEPVFVEIGEGNLEWPEILKACDYADTRWYVVEQDLPAGDRDIFASMAISFNNMKSMGIR